MFSSSVPPARYRDYIGIQSVHQYLTCGIKSLNWQVSQVVRKSRVSVGTQSGAFLHKMSCPTSSPWSRQDENSFQHSWGSAPRKKWSHLCRSAISNCGGCWGLSQRPTSIVRPGQSGAFGTVPRTGSLAGPGLRRRPRFRREVRKIFWRFRMSALGHCRMCNTCHCMLMCCPAACPGMKDIVQSIELLVVRVEWVKGEFRRWRCKTKKRGRKWCERKKRKC